MIDPPRRPLVERIRALAEHFPELAGGDMLSRTVKAVVLPQLARAASKNPEGTEDLILSFTRRFVAALEIPADALYKARDPETKNTRPPDSVSPRAS